jgi:tryptophanyl-tRNA synthetase
MSRILSGVQPSGDLHLGNYLGAIRSWTTNQHDHECLYCVVDLHALTVDRDANSLASLTLQTAALLLASGLDPGLCTIFVQSHIRLHAEAAWLLECVASFGELRRMTQFKDKADGEEASVSVGLFSYPVLMAADIVLYDADRVPVGDDQRQHLELARVLTNRFNRRFGKTFVVPQAAIPPVAARVMDLSEPTRKMSKSVGGNGTVFLTDNGDAIARKIRSAVTDSEGVIRYEPIAKPGVSNLLSILAATTGTSIETLEDELAAQTYGHLKTVVVEAVSATIGPLRKSYFELLSDPSHLARVLDDGSRNAHTIASETMNRALRAVGQLRTEDIVDIARRLADERKDSSVA